MSQNHFLKTGAVSAPRTTFDLSHEYKTTMDMGMLVPILCEEGIPADVWQVANQLVIRCQPMVAPIMHKIKATVHYFKVPYRILDENFEEFLTGGEDGSYVTPQPTWTPTNNGEYSLWDYLAFPTGVIPTGWEPVDYPRRAYARIWNTYFRDQNVMDEIDEDTNEEILYRSWSKGYFTSSLPWQQRGPVQAVPISGLAPVLGLGFDQFVGDWIEGSTGNLVNADGSVTPVGINGWKSPADAGSILKKSDDGEWPDLNADLSQAGSFNVADLREVFQIQKFLERNARSGARFKEFLMAHWKVAPTDARLQRPEYLGGTIQEIVTSEVLQTSSSGFTEGPQSETPQGNLSGHGISVSQSGIKPFKFEEPGLVMALLSIMPEPVYQQGINKQWLRKTRYEFPFPEFVNLSERPINQVEIFATADATENALPFGYQAMFDECRVKQNKVTGQFRSNATQSLDYWHLARNFATAPGLNTDFLLCKPDKRIFFVEDEHGFLINVGHRLKVTRPLPIIGEPGLIDHH